MQKASPVSAGATERRVLRSSTRSAATNPRHEHLAVKVVRRRKCSSRSSCSTARRLGGWPPWTSTVAIASGDSHGPVARRGRDRGRSTPRRGPRLEQCASACGVAHLHDQAPRPPALQLAGAQLLDQPALVDDADARRQAVDLGEDVTGHEHGHAVVRGERAQQVADLDDAGRVEPVGRLVQQQQLGVVEQRGREPQALAVALRERARAALARSARARGARSPARPRRRRRRAAAQPPTGSPRRSGRGRGPGRRRGSRRGPRGRARPVAPACRTARRGPTRAGSCRAACGWSSSCRRR